MSRPHRVRRDPRTGASQGLGVWVREPRTEGAAKGGPGVRARRGWESAGRTPPVPPRGPGTRPESSETRASRLWTTGGRASGCTGPSFRRAPAGLPCPALPCPGLSCDLRGGVDSGRRKPCGADPIPSPQRVSASPWRGTADGARRRPGLVRCPLPPRRRWVGGWDPSVSAGRWG